MVVSPDQLVENAALFGQEAAKGHLLTPAQQQDWRFVAVFAVTSLEQLIKAALAQRNVMLLAELSEPSILGLAGVSTKRPLRTISAARAIDRYAKLDPLFGALAPDLVRLLNVRNGVVHLTSDQPEDFERLFDSYLRATELLLDSADVEEEWFWGDFATVVSARRSDRVKTIESGVNNKVAVAKAHFELKYQTLTDGETRAAIAAAEQFLMLGAEAEIRHKCPACGSVGRVDAGVDVEWVVEDFAWQGYVRISPYAFRCGACDLDLEGDEVEVALGDIDVPDEFDPYDFGDPPDSDIPGYTEEDQHPYPPPH
jgi:hypothetical protein